MSEILSDSGARGESTECPEHTRAFQLCDAQVVLRGNHGPKEILRAVTFTVGRGEVVGIVGRSGTGKTTLLRAMGGLAPTSAGTVHYNGAPITRPPSDVVTVFQDYGNALLPWRTVHKNVALPLEGRLPRGQVRERVDEALELVGLSASRSAHPKQLSGGMQQRVQIARALALRPRVLLMDEPFGALDAMTKAALQDQVLALQAESDSTIVFITHDLDEAIYLSDRVLVISGAPGTISHEFVTKLPRPRNQISTKESPEYLAMRHQLATALGVASS